MDYFAPTSRHLARLQCLRESLDAILEKRSLSSSLCYVHSFEYFEICLNFTTKIYHFRRLEELGQRGFSGDGECAVNLDFRQGPRSDASLAFGSELHKKVYDSKTLLLCSRRLRCPSETSGMYGCSIWLEIIGIWHKKAEKPRLFKAPVYLFWRDVVSSSRPTSVVGKFSTSITTEPVVRPMRSRTIQIWKNGLGEAGGHRSIFDRWEEVVEIGYGVCTTKPYLIKFITPPDQDRVSLMRNPPSADWDHRHDDSLVQFLAQTGRPPDDTGGRAGTIWQHVDRIELSSAVEDMEDAIAYLTDDNPSTFWESDDNQSSHFIRLHMKKNTVVEKLYLTVDTADDTFLPQKIVVYASENKNSSSSPMRKLNQIDDLAVEHTGDICIYEATAEANVQSFVIIEIKILECYDEGIDTRIRGVKLQTKQEEEPNDDVNVQLDADKLQEHPFLLYSAPEPISIKWRAVALKRLATILDSVLSYLVPMHEVADFSSGKSLSTYDDDCSIFSGILEDARFLLPLCHKRQWYFEKLLDAPVECVFETCPKLYINRQLATSNRSDSNSTVFRQVYDGLKTIAHQQHMTLSYRWSVRHEQWWECKFIGEGVIDQGGGFRDSLCDIGDELCPADADSLLPLPYFLRSPNQYEDEHNRDTFVVNPGCNDFDGFEWIGQLLGACLRTKEYLILPLTKFTWKRMLGQPVSWSEDFVSVDRSLVRLMDKIQAMSRDEFDNYFGAKQDYTTCTMMTAILCNGDEVDLVPNGSNIPLTYEDRQDYCERLKKCRINEAKEQINAIRRGLLRVIPEAALRLLTWFELERRIAGNPEVSLDALKKAARYEELDGTERRVKFLWEALENFTNDERSRFLRFVTGRRRLPTPLFICTAKGDSLVNENQNSLPESSTCSGMLFLPDYPSADVCEEKLRYAIYNCVAIDTDMHPWED